MNYEKKYKDALMWIESIYPTLSSEQRMEAEGIFPEIAESEDEKIRKWLLNFVQGLPDEGLDFHFYNLNKEQVIAWLEKQGEQNLANSAKICKEDEEDWSEKDEKILKIIINDIQERHPKATFSTRYMIDWLKSLKERFGCEVNCTTKKNEE